MFDPLLPAVLRGCVGNAAVYVQNGEDFLVATDTWDWTRVPSPPSWLTAAEAVANAVGWLERHHGGVHFNIA